MTEQRSVRLALLADDGTAPVREGTHLGRPHLIVPVVALVGDAVVRPVGSRGPEFVPAEELAYAPAGWNGRPVVPDHPEAGRASANEPDTLEAMAFGALFNTRFEDKRLKTEAWIDIERAMEIGGDAERVVERVRARELVEVSVGCLVSAERRSGVAPDGTPYEFIWHNIVPDHLAMLPEGTKGACSIAAGCGAPRAAQDNEQEGSAMATADPMKLTVNLRGMWARLLAHVRSAAEALAVEGPSDVTLREKIARALFDAVPAFDGIVEVYADDGLVIYATASQESGYVLWRQTFKLDAEGAVTLAGDGAEVEPVTEWKLVAAEGEQDPATARAACGCEQGEGPSASAPTTEGASMTSNKQKELAGRLIACNKSPFAEEDRAALEAFSEERLAALAEALTVQPDPTPPAVPETSTAVEPEKPKTEEELVAALPEHLRALIGRAQAEERAQRDRLVTSLRAAQEVFDEAALKAKPTDELAALAKMLRIDLPAPDYSGKGQPDVRAAGEGAPEPPKPYTEALKALSSPKATN